MNLVTINYRHVWTLKDGTPVYWPENEHVMVISGYNLEKNTITTIDPQQGKKQYDKARFEKIYNDMQKQTLTAY